MQFRLTLLFTLFIYSYIEYRQLANLSGENFHLSVENFHLCCLLPLSLCDLHLTVNKTFTPTSYVLSAFFPMILNEKADFFKSMHDFSYLLMQSTTAFFILL